jgi:Tfp pilus assembly protein PilP
LVTAEGAKGLTAASMKLVGIVHGEQGPLALVETTDGLGYIVKVGDVIGDGRVSEIGGESVTLTVAGRPGQAPSRVVLRLRAD